MLRAVARGVPGAVRGLSTAAVQTSVAQLPRRSIVALEGRDTLKFLQGSVTNNVVALEDAHKNGTPARDAFYTAFLTPQGRIIADSFLYLLPDTPEPSLLMEVDEKIASDLLKFIRRFKLRSKVKITDVSSEWDVYQAWGPNAQGDLGDAALAFRDVRTPDMGWRILARAGAEAPVPGTPVSFDEYTVHRMLNGVPEGADELVNGSSLPLESCIDYMHGGTSLFSPSRFPQGVLYRTGAYRAHLLYGPRAQARHAGRPDQRRRDVRTMAHTAPLNLLRSTATGPPCQSTAQTCASLPTRTRPRPKSVRDARAPQASLSAASTTSAWPCSAWSRRKKRTRRKTRRTSRSV